jgi:hypothetical protein
MKRIFILFLLTAITATGYCQQPATPELKMDLLRKSRNQHTAAWILLGGGFAVTTAGIVVATTEVTHDLVNIFNPEEQKSSSTGAVLIIAGTITMLTSIPLFISSTNNNRKARAITVLLKKEDYTALRHSSFIRLSYPAISLKFDL